MNRYISLLLFIGLAWGQTKNPCEDERYLKIKVKSLDEMSDREYAYFLKFDEKCTDYLESSSTYSGVKSRESIVKPIHGVTLVLKEGLYYAPDLDKLYSGEAVWYWGNGQKQVEGTYKDGERVGLHTSWHYNGQKKKERTYKDGNQDGLSTNWYENGQKLSEGLYKDGKIDGLNTGWYENGQKRLEVSYKNGKYDGLMTEWWENGQKREEITFKDGKKDGKWTKWHDENGKKWFEETHKNGIRVLRTEWSRSGQKKSEGSYRDGRKDGLWNYYFHNGQIKTKSYYRDGKKEGKDTTYYVDDYYILSGLSLNKSGDIHTITEFKDDKKNGIWLKLHQGQVVIEANYKLDSLDGQYIYYFQNGQKETEEIYKDGKMISTKCWDEDGNECECVENGGWGCK